MKTIRNTELFKILKKTWTTYEGKMPSKKYWTAGETEMDILWNALHEPGQDHILIDPETPHLIGGLDHCEITKKGFYFHDIGCNDKDNSFVIRSLA
jgi:hypothetical protein